MPIEPTVYNQTISHRFGVELIDLLADESWTHLDVAVAWVRRSGVRHIVPALTEFLNRNGAARFVVGVDIENTSKEGLQDLLSLAAHGNIKTFIHHNEHAAVTFHPKVYIFYNDAKARLIVGSNNLTESGLFTNTEAGLQIDAAINDSVIVTMQHVLESWCDTSEGLSRLLDDEFLAALVDAKYVHSEQSLNRRRAQSRGSGTGTGGTPPRLFKSKPEAAPAPPLPAMGGGIGGQRPPRKRTSAPTGDVGTVLLIRPRLSRAKRGKLPTQMQVPIPLKDGPFLNGVNEMISDHMVSLCLDCHFGIFAQLRE